MSPKRPVLKSFATVYYKRASDFVVRDCSLLCDGKALVFTSGMMTSRDRISPSSVPVGLFLVISAEHNDPILGEL